MARKLRLGVLFCISSIAGVLAISKFCLVASLTSFASLRAGWQATPLVIGGLCFANALHIWKQMAWARQAARQSGVRGGAARLRGS